MAIACSSTAGDDTTIYSKNGADVTRRLPTIATAVLALPVRSCIIDGELIAAGVHSQPDFLALLHGRHAPVCVYAFDLMELRGHDLRDQPRETASTAQGTARPQQGLTGHSPP
jgi:ATP-dependent DNA ligase